MVQHKIDITKPLIYVRGGQFTGDKGWIHDRRLPTDYEVIIGIKGSLYLTIGDELFTIKENDICIVPPHIIHEGSKSLTEETSFYWLHFLVNEQSTNERSVTLPMYNHLDNIESIMLLSKYALDKAMSHTSKENLDYAISLVLLEIDSKINTKHNISNNLVVQVEEYVRINIYQNLSVKDVATHFNYSSDYISNIFRNYYGYSLKKYILNQEISEIKNLLLTTNISIKEIARKFNFNDDKYLMRMFKKHEQITMSNYRKSFIKVKLNSDTVDE